MGMGHAPGSSRLPPSLACYVPDPSAVASEDECRCMLRKSAAAGEAGDSALEAPAVAPVAAAAAAGGAR